MSTPEAPVQDPHFREGDTFNGLTRDACGRWFTDWGLWVLSDQHMTGISGSPVCPTCRRSDA